ncbi:MAG: hypothetical protein KDD62_07485 [Bdellovibrionales bacterium]|nr:hypothetical protein [Bdellovibrionales bacterium]
MPSQERRAPVIEVTESLEKILRLHGDEFESLVGVTPERVTEELSNCGEPPRAHESSRPPNAFVRSIVDKVTLAYDRIDVTANRHVVAEQLNTAHDVFSNIIALEVTELSPTEFLEFDRELASQLLSRIAQGLKALPKRQELIDSSDPLALLATMSDEVQKGLYFCAPLRTLNYLVDRDSPVSRIMAANFEHDAMDYFCQLREACRWYSRQPEFKMDAALEYVLGDLRSFVIQVIEGNLAISKGVYELKEESLMQVLMPAVRINSNRFQLLVREGSSDEYAPHGTIIVSGVQGMPVVCDAAALALPLYNLIKNPLKLASLYGREVPGVHIRAEASTDGKCTAIFVRDSGTGFSSDELMSKFTKEALEKSRNGQPLSFLEECLIDEAMRDHIPFRAIANLLCNRGATTGGGTGIGLSLAKQIIEEGHQGALRLYQHPSLGAGVQILLPMVEADLSPEKRMAITRASLHHQIENGLPRV